MEVAFKGGKIAYQCWGKGKPVILLHGFLESSNMWLEYGIALAKGRKVIAIDLPGHGSSDSFGYMHTMELMADAVRAVLKEEKIRRPIIIGHSLGGYVALALAENYPDLPKGICMFFSTARADSDEKKRNRDRAIALVKRNYKSFIRATIPMLFRPKHRKLFRMRINQLKKQALTMNPRGISAALEGMKVRKDREVLLRFAPYPIHFVAGGKDPVIPLKHLEEQAQEGEHISLTVFPNIGHMGFIEAQEACLADIRRWINTL